MIGCMEEEALNYDEEADTQGECLYGGASPPIPRVTSTMPANGAVDVDVGLSSMSVTFDIPMLDESWSWVTDGESPFPGMIGEPWYDEDRTTNTLSVSLEADTDYVIWLNSDVHQNFTSDQGVAAEPYRWSFSTGSADNGGGDVDEEEQQSNTTSETNTTDGGTEQDLVIGPIPDEWSMLEGEGLFSKHIRVFGIHIFATTDTPDGKLMHAAGVLAQYLDNDEDGVVDDSAVVENMTAVNASIVMVAYEEDMEDIFENVPESIHQMFDAGEFWAQDLYGEETIPPGSSEDRFDASLEEIWHLISSAGYARAYPDAFAEEEGSVLANNMDLARGGHFEETACDECEGDSQCALPSGGNYPVDAWYSYDDPTCDYSCMVTEYFYWALTSMLGAQSERCEDIDVEWDACTNDLMQSMDPATSELLNDSEYNLPTRLPNGHYMSFYHIEMDSCISHSDPINHFHPYLILIIDGEQQTLPEGVGIEQGCMHVIHTHDSSGRLHVEYPAAAQYDGLPIGLFMHFFEMQFDSCTLGEHSVDELHELNMTIYDDAEHFSAGDGVDSEAFENYLLSPERDGEVILLRYGEGEGRLDCP